MSFCSRLLSDVPPVKPYPAINPDQLPSVMEYSTLVTLDASPKAVCVALILVVGASKVALPNVIINPSVIEYEEEGKIVSLINNELW